MATQITPIAKEYPANHPIRSSDSLWGMNRADINPFSVLRVTQYSQFNEELEISTNAVTDPTTGKQEFNVNSGPNATVSVPAKKQEEAFRNLASKVHNVVVSPLFASLLHSNDASAGLLIRLRNHHSLQRTPYQTILYVCVYDTSTRIIASFNAHYSIASFNA